MFLKFLFLTTCCYVKWSVGKLSLSDPEAQSKLYRGADAGPGYGKMNGGSLDRLCDFVCVGEGGGGRQKHPRKVEEFVKTYRQRK